jgi:hypothetical protein
VSALGSIEESELMRILDGEGLTCCATHEPTRLIVDEPQRVVERLNKLRCRYTAVPSPGDFPLQTREQVLDYAKQIERAGEVLFNAGQVLTYHTTTWSFVALKAK